MTDRSELAEEALRILSEAPDAKEIHDALHFLGIAIDNDIDVFSSSALATFLHEVDAFKQKLGPE